MCFPPPPQLSGTSSLINSFPFALNIDNLTFIFLELIKRRLLQKWIGLTLALVGFSARIVAEIKQSQLPFPLPRYVLLALIASAKMQICIN